MPPRSLFSSVICKRGWVSTIAVLFLWWQFVVCQVMKLQVHRHLVSQRLCFEMTTLRFFIALSPSEDSCPVYRLISTSIFLYSITGCVSPWIPLSVMSSSLAIIAELTSLELMILIESCMKILGVSLHSRLTAIDHVSLLVIVTFSIAHLAFCWFPHQA